MRAGNLYISALFVAVLCGSIFQHYLLLYFPNLRRSRVNTSHKSLYFSTICCCNMGSIFQPYLLLHFPNLRRLCVNTSRESLYFSTICCCNMGIYIPALFFAVFSEFTSSARKYEPQISISQHYLLLYCGDLYLSAIFCGIFRIYVVCA